MNRQRIEWLRSKRDLRSHDRDVYLTRLELDQHTFGYQWNDVMTQITRAFNRVNQIAAVPPQEQRCGCVTTTRNQQRRYLAVCPTHQQSGDSA